MTEAFPGSICTLTYAVNIFDTTGDKCDTAHAIGIIFKDEPVLCIAVHNRLSSARQDALVLHNNRIGWIWGWDHDLLSKVIR